MRRVQVYITLTLNDEMLAIWQLPEKSEYFLLVQVRIRERVNVGPVLLDQSGRLVSIVKHREC